MGRGAIALGGEGRTPATPLQYSGTLGSFVGGVGGAFSILQSTGSQNGYLSSTDWTRFNNSVASTSIDTLAEFETLWGSAELRA